MGEGTLRVDTAQVRDLATDLGTVHRELTGADDNSRTVADAVGHDGLADSLRRFATAWDDRRREIADQLTDLREAAGAIADSFDETDSELARALNEASS